MSPFIIPILGISCAILAIIGRAFVKPWLRLKERQLEIQSNQAAEKAAQYVAHTDRLEQRVRVLERIVTDNGIAIADQIEGLRDQPVN
jgi:ABC-type phosphate transport system auxiliary subunit